MNTLFNCTKCKASFRKASQLNDHLLKIHGQKTTFKCLKCLYFGGSVRSIQNHMRDNHSNLEKAACNNMHSDIPYNDEDMVLGEEEHQEIFEIQKLILNKEIGIIFLMFVLIENNIGTMSEKNTYRNPLNPGRSKSSP